YQIRLDRGLVGPQLARSQRRALADARVDHDAVDAAEFVGKLSEHLRHLLVIVDVQRGDRDGDAGMSFEQFRLQFIQPVGAPSAQRQVAALRGEYAGHAGTQARRGTGDQDLLPSHGLRAYLSSRDSLRSASTLPPVWHV